MTKLLAACLTFIAFTIIGSSASAADFAAADLKMDAIKQTLELQLERIRNAREKADTQMSLARMRIAERLRLSSEEMARQLEVLQRLREQLSEGTGDSQQAIDQLRSNWAGLLDTAFAEINSQVSQTNDLISQMEALRNNFQDPQGRNRRHFPGRARKHSAPLRPLFACALQPPYHPSTIPFRRRQPPRRPPSYRLPLRRQPPVQLDPLPIAPPGREAPNKKLRDSQSWPDALKKFHPSVISVYN